MTEHSTEQRTDTAPRSRPPSPPPAATGLHPVSGWVRFAGIVMVVVGLFGVVEGLFALLTPTYYVTGTGVIVTVGLGAWAWIHLIVGALVALTGAALLSGDQPWSRVVGMVIVGLSALVHLVWLPAAPLWSIVVIALDVAILAALARASGDDRRTV
jgi:vacuolar-type H+-ATPase subunit I/STV1